MEMISRFVFLPLTICLLVITFNEKLRGRVLAMRGIASLENRLGGLERLYWLAFALIMAAGVFTRCYRFLELPLGVNQDGTLAAAEAYCLAMDGTDQYGRSWPTYFEAWKFSQMSTLYSCLMIPFIKVLGLSKLTLRLPMLLVSLAMLPLIWDFARRIAGKGFALCVLLIAATSPWQILQSRWALEANLMPHVLLTGMYLLYLGREKRWALYLSMVFFALTPYAYGVACFVTPVILVCAAAFYLARRKANVPDVIVCVLIFAGIAGPYFYTMLINALGLETAQMGPITMPFFEKSLRSNDMAFTQDNPYFQMLWNLLPHLGTWLCLGNPGALQRAALDAFRLSVYAAGFPRRHLQHVEQAPCIGASRRGVPSARWRDAAAHLAGRGHVLRLDDRRRDQPEQCCILSADDAGRLDAVSDGEAPAHSACAGCRHAGGQLRRSERDLFYGRSVSEDRRRFLPSGSVSGARGYLGLGL